MNRSPGSGFLLWVQFGTLAGQGLLTGLALQYVPPPGWTWV